jgi:hypothetical protein
MERNRVILIAAGLVISAGLAIINIYIGGIALIIVLSLAMSFQIMQETTSLADVAVTLLPDAKGIRAINRGNIPAYHIHISLVPLNKEFELDTLDPDKTTEIPMEIMINEAKAIVKFESKGGEKFQKTYQLSALGVGDDDILKPMFPLFRQE